MWSEIKNETIYLKNRRKNEGDMVASNEQDNKRQEKKKEKAKTKRTENKK